MMKNSFAHSQELSNEQDRHIVWNWTSSLSLMQAISQLQNTVLPLSEICMQAFRFYCLPFTYPVIVNKQLQQSTNYYSYQNTEN